MLKRVLTLLILAAVLSVLIAWERSLAQREETTRQESVRLTRLFDVDRLTEKPIAAMRLDTGTGAMAVYLFDPKGFWRILNLYGVPAREEQIDTLLPRIIEGRGVLQSQSADDAEAYGFGTEETLRLSLLGPDWADAPDGDVIYSLEIGKSIPATGGSYVREFGTTAIYAADFNLRDVLEPDAERPLPPMLDLRLVPEAWVGIREGVGGIRIEQPGRPPVVLYRSERELSDEEREFGMPPWEWIVGHGEHAYAGDPAQIMAYAMFLMRVEYMSVLSPGDRPELGFDQPRGVIGLESAGGEQMHLIFGDRGPRGGIPVINTVTEVMYELPGALWEHFFPDVDLLLHRDLGNPWEPWMRQERDRTRQRPPGTTPPF